ncbi:MAG TPA: DUF1127 domain-containing protein [Acetobacteraceae bacterium]
MPNTLPHYFRDEPEYMPAPQAPGLFARLGGALRWLIELPRRRAVMDELGALSEHELADIGLSRADVTRVFDPEFAVRRNRERMIGRTQNGRVIAV